MSFSDLEKQSEISETNRTRNKPPIPEMPKTIEKCLALLKKKHECLSTTGPQADYQPGMIAEMTSEMKCPFCGMKFAQFQTSGCFGGGTSPHNCPNCDFPRSIEKIWLALRRKERENT